MKKNNKGFSLVELIVVILIMAIIAVALAPQVMKWVDQSKVSTDVNNRANLKSAMDAAVADFFAEKGSFTTDLTIKVDKEPTGWDDRKDVSGNVVIPVGFKSAVDEVTNGFWPEFKSNDAGYFQVKIDQKGAV